MLCAVAKMGNLTEKAVEAVVDDKDELFKILDSVVEIKIPPCAAVLNIGGYERCGFLLDHVDHAFKVAAVAGYEFITRHLEQVLDRCHAEVAKDVESVRFD